MNLVPLNIPPGVVRGATEYETPGRYWDCNLIRWRQGVMEPIGGWVAQSAANLPLGSRVRRIIRWRDNSNFLRTVILTNTEMRAFSGTDYIDITPQGPFTAEFTSEFENQTIASFDTAASLPVGYGVGPYGEETYGTPRSTPSELLSILIPVWSADNWGEDLLAVSSADGHLLYWDVTNPSDRATYVSTAPENNRFVFVTEERHAVLLQAGGEKRRVAWSSREDFTDWDFASTTNTAGFLELESKTPLSVALRVRNGTLIWSESEVFVMRYVGQPFVYGVDELEESRIVGPRAVATDSGVAFWWASDGFYKSDGSVVQPVPCPVWDYLQGCLCPTALGSLTFASSHGLLPEIWWFFPALGSTVADRYVIYNWLENWWSIGTLTRAAMSPAIGGEKPIMADTSGNIFQHETGWLNGNTSRVGDIFVESSVVRIPPAGGQNMEIKQLMVANGYDYDSFRVTVYGRQTPAGTERTFGPYTARPDGYIDTRVTARDVRFRIDAINDSDWSLGEMRADVAAGAKR